VRQIFRVLQPWEALEEVSRKQFCLEKIFSHTKRKPVVKQTMSAANSAPDFISPRGPQVRRANTEPTSPFGLGLLSHSSNSHSDDVKFVFDVTQHQHDTNKHQTGPALPRPKKAQSVASFGPQPPNEPEHPKVNIAPSFDHGTKAGQSKDETELQQDRLFCKFNLL